MEHRLLEYFLAVCAELHFTRAAENLGISQPTLSHQIQLLEHRVGTPLFHRIGRKVYLSEAGEIMRSHSLNVFHELEQAQKAMDELRGMQRGRLRMGCSGNHFLMPSILSFHDHYPRVELSILELPSEQTKERLLTNQLDMGVIFLSQKNEQLHQITLFQEKLLFVVSSQHELFKTASISLQELQQHSMAMLPHPFHVRSMIDLYCQQAGFELKPIIELSTLEALLQWVKNQKAGAILPLSYIQQLNDPHIHGITIQDPTPLQNIGIVYRKETYLCASMKYFIARLTAQYNVIR